MSWVAQELFHPEIFAIAPLLAAYGFSDTAPDQGVLGDPRVRDDLEGRRRARGPRARRGALHPGSPRRELGPAQARHLHGGLRGGVVRPRDASAAAALQPDGEGVLRRRLLRRPRQQLHRRRGRRSCRIRAASPQHLRERAHAQLPAQPVGTVRVREPARAGHVADRDPAAAREPAEHQQLHVEPALPLHRDPARGEHARLRARAAEAARATGARSRPASRSRRRSALRSRGGSGRTARTTAPGYWPLVERADQGQIEHALSLDPAARDR